MYFEGCTGEVFMKEKCVLDLAGKDETLFGNLLKNDTK